MSSMEIFIVTTSLLASGAGGLILLVSLAGKRAHLVKAFNIQQEIDSLDHSDTQEENDDQD